MKPSPEMRPDSGMLVVSFAALVAAALAIGGSPTFVRLAEMDQVGPLASAFWRVGAALPLLWAWAVVEARVAGAPVRSAFQMDMPILVAGLLFAADLVVWHLAIVRTAVANASFLALMMPVWVLLGSVVLLKEKVDGKTVLGVALALSGATVFLGFSYTFAVHQLTGDGLAIATSIFFAGYFLAVRAARRRSPPGRILFLSSLISAVILLPAALVTEGALLPTTADGYLAILGLAIISHVAGQGLTAFALGHLPAAFSSLVTYLGALSGAAMAWLFLDEAMSPVQLAGGGLIMLGIYLARPRRVKPA